MPFKDPEKMKAYHEKYREAHREQHSEANKKWRAKNIKSVKENERRRNYNKTHVKKRCPACRKGITVNKRSKQMICPHCGIKIQVSGVSEGCAHHKNTHGVRLWVPVSQRFKK